MATPKVRSSDSDSQRRVGRQPPPRATPARATGGWSWAVAGGKHRRADSRGGESGREGGGLEGCASEAHQICTTAPYEKKKTPA